jgi:hypothetical protein
MKKTYLFLFLLFSTQIFSEPEMDFIYLLNEKKLRCSNLHGCNLDECIKEIKDKFEYKENMEALDKGQLEGHLKRTLQSYTDYQTLFDQFSEEEWIEKIYNKLSPDIQNSMPKTREDQRKFIENMKGNAIYNILPSKETSKLIGIGILIGFGIGMYAGPYAKKLYHKATGIPEVTP